MILLFPVAALVIACFISLLVLNLVILSEFLQVLSKRGKGYSAAIVVFFSIIMGLIWGISLDRMAFTTVCVFFISLIPVVKFCRSWQRNTMPANKLYASALKISFMPCCLLLLVGATGVLNIASAPKKYVGTDASKTHLSGCSLPVTAGDAD